MGRLEGKNAIVVGSSSGLGRGIALIYAREGAKVVCCDTRRETIDADVDTDRRATVDVINASGGDAIYVQCDISKENEVINLINTSVAKYGHIDIVVCNAGVYRAGGNIRDLPSEYYDICYQTNVKGTTMVCKYALAHMTKEKIKGAFVMTCSSSGLNPYPNQAPYSMSKAAVAMLTQSLALEFGPYGIRANAICPSNTRTAMLKNVDPKILEMFVKRVPMQRLGEIEDIANLALFLGSDESSWISGDLIAIDGGETLSNIQSMDYGIYPD